MKSAPPVILPDPPEPPTPLGLIAGGGQLPLLVAKGMKSMGHPVRCLGLAGQFEPELRDLCDDFSEVGALRFNSWGKRLKAMGVEYAVMVGQVDKARMMHSWATIIRNTPDLRALWMFQKLRRDRRSHLILASIADELAKDGVDLIDSTAHISDHLATSGTMTRCKPSNRQRTDIQLGWPLLQEMLRLDIGQAIAVRGGDVVAVEAVEGTDRMIKRCGELCRSGGWTLLKGARAGHDRRSDVPTIGPTTIQNLHDNGGRCIALSAGDVIIIDKPQTLELADRLGVSVVGIPQGPTNTEMRVTANE